MKGALRVESEGVLARYRLALFLVPDETAAGDLFMAARDDADLLRRARRWRRAQGLPELSVGPDGGPDGGPELSAGPAALPELPELDAEQVALARHLALRSGQRRRWRAGALLVGAVAGALASLFGSSHIRMRMRMQALAGDGMAAIGQRVAPLDLAVRELGEVVYQIPDAREVTGLTMLADRTYCLLTPGPERFVVPVPGTPPYFTDTEGRRYPVLELAPQSRDGQLQYSMVALNPPPWAVFVSLTVPKVAERLTGEAPALREDCSAGC